MRLHDSFSCRRCCYTAHVVGHINIATHSCRVHIGALKDIAANHLELAVMSYDKRTEFLEVVTANRLSVRVETISSVDLYSIS